MSEHRRRPKRIRVSGLQETQLPDVVDVDHAAVAQCLENGARGEGVAERSGADIVALTRQHNLQVAEADHQVAGYSAWRDESPGVAYIETILVHPDWQRAGVGTKLLTAIHDEARDTKLKFMIVRCLSAAPWALSFFKKFGFVELNDEAPPKVQHWKEEVVASGKPLSAPEQVVLWASVKEPPEPEEDEDQDDDEASGDGA